MFYHFYQLLPHLSFTATLTSSLTSHCHLLKASLLPSHTLLLPVLTTPHHPSATAFLRLRQPSPPHDVATVIPLLLYLIAAVPNS